MPGATNYILSGNGTNDNITSTPSSSLSVATATIPVACPWVKYKYSTLNGYGTTINNTSPSFPSFCVHILGDWVPIAMCHFFPFLLPLVVLVLIVPFDSSLRFDTLFAFDLGSFVWVVVVVVVRNYHWSSMCVKNISLYSINLGFWGIIVINLLYDNGNIYVCYLICCCCCHHRCRCLPDTFQIS